MIHYELLAVLVVIGTAIAAYLINKHVKQETQTKCSACGELLPWGTEHDRCVVCRQHNRWSAPQ